MGKDSCTEASIDDGGYDMLELFELGEAMEDTDGLKEIKSQIKDLQESYQEAVDGNHKDMAEYYRGKIDELMEQLGAHGSDEESDGQPRDDEIFFGSSDLKTCVDRVEYWKRDMEHHRKLIEYDINHGYDASGQTSDYNSAKRQYESALKQLEDARKKAKQECD